MLKLNRFIVLTTVIAGLLVSLGSVGFVSSLYSRLINSAFVVSTQGDVIPLELVSQKENLTIEALAHLDTFHRLFYGIDASNYEKNLAAALWLGDSSVDNLYRQKKSDGLYNRLLQYSLIQKVVELQTDLQMDADPFSFETRLIFEINRGQTTDTYELVTIGNLIQVDRHFPNNTHGLLITNYFEKSLQKITSNEN